jgi:hypothetical protein
MTMSTQEERYARVIANRRHATNATSTPPATSTATLRTACAPKSGESTCPKCGGVRQAEQRAAAGPNDAPPPPDVGERIRANRRQRPDLEREAARVAGVRTLLRPNGPLPVREDATMGLHEPLVTAANAEQHAAPPPPSLIDRIRQKKQGGVK